MRKRLLFALPVVLIAAAFFAILSSDRLMFSAVRGIVAATTSYRLELRNASLTWLPFTLRSELVLVAPDYADAAPLFALQQLAVEGSLLDWARGRNTGRLQAGNLSVYIDATAPGGRPPASTVLRPLTLFPTRIDIQTMHFISRGEEVWVFPIQNVSAQRRDDGVIAAIASTSHSDNPLVLEALLTPRTQLGYVQAVDVLVGVTGRDESSRLVLDGALRAGDNNLFYDLALQGDYANVSDFLQAFDDDAISLQGKLAVAGRLEGSFDRLLLRMDNLVLDNADAYQLRINGELIQEGSQSPTLAVSASGSVAGTAVLSLIPGALQDHLGTAAMTLRIEGTLARPLIRDVQLNAASPDGLELEAVARNLRAKPDDLLATLDAAPVRVTLRGDSAAALEALIGDLPAFGGWKLEGELRRMGDRYSLADLSGEISLGDAASLQASGGIGSIELPGNNAPVVIGDLLLDFEFRDDDGSWRQQHAVLRELPAQLQSAGFSVSGSIADASTMRGLALELTVGDLQLAASPTTPPWVPLPLALAGTSTLTRAGSEWRFGDIVFDGGLADGSRIELRGSAAAGAGAATADLVLELAAAAGDALPWPGPLKVETSGASVQFRLRERFATALGQITTGHEPLQTVLSADLREGEIQQLSLDVYAEEFDLSDARLARAKQAEDGGEPEDGDDKPFDWQRLQPAIPVHGTLRIKEVRGSSTSINSFAVDVEGGATGWLLRQLDASYAGGSLQLRGVLDTSGDSPAVSVAGLGYRMPLADLTRDLGLTESTTGTLSLRGGVSATGGDSQALLKSLQGRVALAADNVTVAGPAYDLLMSNLLAWLVTGAQENTTTFDCSMAQFDINDGVGASDTLYIETPRMVATGKARIDLGASTLDARLQPRSRTRAVQFPSDVKISGPLSGPKVSVSPLQSTFDAAAQALLLLPGLTMRLFGLGAAADGPPKPCEASLQ